MNSLSKQQRELFDALHEDKVQDYKVFSKRDYGRLFSSLIDKYPETAHFIYELLQNAEDANASYVSILLKQNCLIFKHNGSKHFDVTPIDSDSPLVGDINSITGFGFSSKVADLDSEQEISTQKIGKFGVGFKSVFQYTDTPEIYDDTYCFKIENYIIPTLLEEDYPTRQKGETLFVFRFKEQNRVQAYEHIKKRLQNLKNPLLFLRNIKKITWSIDASNEPKTQYTYEKIRTEKHLYHNGTIKLERIQLLEPQEKSCIFLFSKTVMVEDKGNFPIYVGFYYDEKKKKLITNVKRNIYCFFPTKISFNTCFIAHAPFLLTDNRQDLKPDTDINVSLVEELATLSADAVVLLRNYGKKQNHLLIDENITEICPQYECDYYGDDNNIYEAPFKEAFKDILEEEPLLLSRNNKYLLPVQSYQTVTGIFELLEQGQFERLRLQYDYYNESKGVDFLQWKLAMNLQKLDDECEYFEEVQRYEIEDFGRDINVNFMRSMEYDWVIKFYNFLREHASAHINITNQNKNSELVFRSAPIIKTQNDEWVAPFIDKTIPNVYLPIRGGKNNAEGYNFINKKYLDNEYAKKLFTQLELKTPDEYDYIRNIVLGKYEGEEFEIDDNILISDFEVLLNFYQKVLNTNREDEFIQLLKDKLYLVGTDHILYRPNELILETKMLKEYFAGDRESIFFDLYFYRKQIHSYKSKFIEDFVLTLGVKTKPMVMSRTFTNEWSIAHDSHLKKELDKLEYYTLNNIVDYYLEGFVNACCHKNITKELSIYLWNEIISNHTIAPQAEILYRKYHKKYSNLYKCNSSFFCDLFQCEWIYNKYGELCKTKELHIEDLAPEYNIYNGVCELLGIEKSTPDMQEKYGVTDEEQEQFELGQKAKALGLTQEDLEKLAKEKRDALAREQAINNQVEESNDSIPTPLVPQPKEDINDRLKKKIDERKNRHIGKPHSKPQNDELDSFDRNSNDNMSTQNDKPFFVDTKGPVNSPLEDTNETTRAEKKLKAKNTIAQETAENSSELVELLELLTETPKYSFKWFKILMLLMHEGKTQSTKRQIQIDFSRYELLSSDKVLHLYESSIPIPVWVCDAEKYSITALSEKMSAKIDGLIVKTDDKGIYVSIELNDKLLSDLKKAKKIRLIATDNTNIIDSLETRFLQLDYEDDYDMNINLPKNLSFIYGPPGTGKTTELIKQVHELLEREPNAKILVLTPTNKAADVVALKMANDEVCEPALARYGATESFYLVEEIGCLTTRDTTDMDWHNIVVATAARYAYDYVQPNDTAICDYPWDYIFIDEASMIDIITITYILHKGADATKIIISGDPKQIQPVAQNDLPAYNIYDMVDLHGFYEAMYDYERFEVKGLTMQHRSIPSIGKLVSDFAYDGLVESDSNRAQKKPLKLDGIHFTNINFIGFDVAELDDIRGLNSINESAFNLYSVIFSYNMIAYTIKQIEKYYPEKEYSIGVVCAYRAQSDAIKNMLENQPLDTMYCKVTAGTVHSFQGDECDIMFIVLNPPALCSTGSHVNNENIINVAMSRARDYIFFVTPKGQHKGFFMKNKIGKVLEAQPLEGTILDCQNIESVMFEGNSNFIYENTHVTCHMPVNVYCEDSALYEVRMSDDALDIKINNQK